MRFKWVAEIVTTDNHQKFAYVDELGGGLNDAVSGCVKMGKFEFYLNVKIRILEFVSKKNIFLKIKNTLEILNLETNR